MCRILKLSQDKREQFIKNNSHPIDYCAVFNVIRGIQSSPCMFALTCASSTISTVINLENSKIKVLSDDGFAIIRYYSSFLG